METDAERRAGAPEEEPQGSSPEAGGEARSSPEAEAEAEADVPALREAEEGLSDRAALFGEIMEDAHRSVRTFVDSVSQKSEEIILEAEEEVRRSRLAMIEKARTQVETLKETADGLIGEAGECLAELERARTAMISSSERLQRQIDELIDPPEAGAQVAPGRRFGLR